MKINAIGVMMALPVLSGARETRSLDREACEITAIYRAIETPAGAVSLSSGGSIEAIETLLVPTKLEAGEYDVRVRRKANDLYEVNGGSRYIVTRYCYHFGARDQAVLKIGAGMFDRSTIEW